MTRKNKKARKKEPQKSSKSKPRLQDMTEMPSPSDYNYQRLATESSEDEINEKGRKLKVYIYESELAKIKNWVLLYTDIETGGDLFGLWIDSHTAVVQFALGPGKNCKRYETAFFQDLDYLASAGGYLTAKHGLCNLGQWHSHHQLSLNKPSTGDENTVWGHMPTLGLTRYIVCIANISSRRGKYHAGVNCFLFELDDRRVQLPVIRGKFHTLGQASPVNEHAEIAQVITQGAESLVESVCDDDGDLTEESCWQKLKRVICPTVRSHTGKAYIIIGFISVGLIVVAIVYLTTKYDDVHI